MKYVTRNRRTNGSSDAPCSMLHAPFHRGFTLVEMLVAFGIFAVIMVVAVGSLVSLLEANHKAQAQKTVVDNLQFAFENMSRNIRTGTNYHCGPGSITVAQDCPTTPDSLLVFKTRDGAFMAYRLEGGALTRSKDPDAGELLKPGKFISITAPEITLEQVGFYVDGTDKFDKKQPRVLIVAKGFMQGKSKVVSRFSIETLVSQRLLDL